MDNEQKDPLVPANTPPPKPAPPPPAPPPPPPPTQSAADLDKILLPKKEIPGQTLKSAERINAGALLQQEQTAAKEGTKAQGSTPAPKPAAPATKPAAPKEDSIVRPLETFQGDIERAVKEKNVSVVSIATAEAERRAKTSAEAKPLPGQVAEKRWTLEVAMIAAGVLLLAAASGVLAFIFIKPAPAPAPEAGLPQAPFILVDDTKVVRLVPGQSSRDALLTNLEAAKQAVSLSLGLIARLLPATASTTPQGEALTALTGPQFLSLLAPTIPVDLLRAVQPNYLLGAHVYDGNQAFLMLRVDSYETAYAGMLAWEPNLSRDLAPLFTYTPRAHIPEENLSVATTTASTTVSTPQFTPPPSFVDKIVENHDARVLQNQYGDIYLMWTFLDRNTIVITTNVATLREIITRLQNAPITPIPGQ